MSGLTGKVVKIKDKNHPWNGELGRVILKETEGFAKGKYRVALLEQEWTCGASEEQLEVISDA